MSTRTPDPIVLERRLAELDAAAIELTERALGAEQRLARAAQLYAAVSELHEATEPAEVVTVIKEIVANLLGCEEMGVYEVIAPGPVCSYIDGIGLDADRFATLPTTHTLVQSALVSRLPVVPEDPAATTLLGRPVAAVVPLRDGEMIRGLVILFALLRQKPRFEPADVELIEAVARHAGRALANARLREPAR